MKTRTSAGGLLLAAKRAIVVPSDMCAPRHCQILIFVEAPAAVSRPTFYGAPHGACSPVRHSDHDRPRFHGIGSKSSY